MAWWQHFKVSGSNAEVYTILSTPADSTVSTLGDKTVYNSSFQGVNGTFFGSDSVYGIAIAGGTAVRAGGLKNGNSSTDRNRSTMYMTTNGTVGVTRVINASSLPGGVSKMKWAIGGLGLYLDENLTKSQYDSRLQNDEGSEGVGGVNDKRPRTMLGYSSNAMGFPVMIMAFVKTGITFYDGREIMSGLGCTKGIHLDGGSSSSIRLVDQPQDGPSKVIRFETTSTPQKTIFRSTSTYSTRVPSPFTDIW
ncbi:phosphodiester glycosidase family protein [Paenibacillus thiaminolyticus]|uniref:phosphodiester glycosidase family protein n=1 Tax=Paenibacillus thiaminolyticus TaxID=49283 RepID=UPI00232C4EEB|nr:phosphodiester glycosidase family protein [Paenibacillus thiaminolyticus]WCF08258.1 phosphodiester glycosidase family protein [Paenibacillus thiaminolyticus]